MARVGLAFLLAALVSTGAFAAAPANVPPEIEVPTALIEQLYGYLRDKPFGDVEQMIAGLRDAVAKATAKPPAPPAPASPKP